MKLFNILNRTTFSEVNRMPDLIRSVAPILRTTTQLLGTGVLLILLLTVVCLPLTQRKQNNRHNYDWFMNHTCPQAFKQSKWASTPTIDSSELYDECSAELERARKDGK